MGSSYAVNSALEEDNTQTDNDLASAQYLNVDNEQVSNSSVPAGDTERDEPAISGLLVVAEEFNAAFITALFGLAASRRLVRKR